MSWLASFIISGLMMSNFGSVESNAPNINTNTDKSTAEIIQTTGGEEIERFDQAYPFNSNGTVALSNINGSVTIETWDKNEVRVEYTKAGSDKEIMSWVDVRIDATKDRLEIEANYDKWKGNNSGDWEKWKGRKLTVTFKLTVPRSAILNEIETVNGSIVLSNLVNNCKVSTVNGQVSARNLRGNANLSTVNGVVDADFEKLDPNARINLETVNGKVLLVIPSDADATLKADTVNGSITNEFGLPVRKGRYVGRDLHGRVGNGATKINLSSVNGGLALTRKQDGRPSSPAVNLLTQKDEEDDVDVDDDKDNDNEQDLSGAVERDVERAVRNAVRAIPAIVVDANTVVLTDEALKELSKAQKEVIKAEKDAALASTEKALNGQLRSKLREQQRQLDTLGSMYRVSSPNVLPSVEKQSDTFVVKGVPKITVDAKNCDVIVRGWDRSEVQYSLTRFSRNGTQTPRAGITVDKGESSVKLNVMNHNPAIRYRLEIFVPKKSNLKISSDKEIRLDGVSGELDLSATNDEINVRDSDGKLTVASGKGNVRVVGFDGELNSTTSEGTVSLEGTFSKLNADAGDGTIILTLPENSGAYLSTDTDKIYAEGLSLAKEDDKWKIGKGGDTYRILTTPEGKVVVRNSSRLKAAY